jgi:hypothetical protein
MRGGLQYGRGPVQPLLDIRGGGIGPGNYSNEMQISYCDQNRTGDHIWYISDLSRFQKQYPKWTMRYDVRRILEEMYTVNRNQWESEQ